VPAFKIVIFRTIDSNIIYGTKTVAFDQIAIFDFKFQNGIHQVTAREEQCDFYQ